MALLQSLMQALGLFSLRKQLPLLANMAADLGLRRMASVKRSDAFWRSPGVVTFEIRVYVFTTTKGACIAAKPSDTYRCPGSKN